MNSRYIMGKIKILDCTLRDGGYINKWAFKDNHIARILASLCEARVDIVECGYLSMEATHLSNTTMFGCIGQADRFAQKMDSAIHKVVMINFGEFDIDTLPCVHQYGGGKIDGVRLAFHKENLNDAVLSARGIKKKGYNVFFQPMVTKYYSDIEFLEMLEKVNVFQPYAFYIVDSFGSMTPREFEKYILLANDNLNSDIALGYHSHNNMQLAFANAIKLCSVNFDRDVILDSSVYGMGRGAGNLNTELIADFLNKEFGGQYNITSLLEIIDSLLEGLMSRYSWGFSPAQYLSASFDIHPNYASYLTSRNTNHIVTIQKILEKIPRNKRSKFDRNLIERLYIETVCEKKIQVKDRLKSLLGKKVILLAPGSSILTYRDALQVKVKQENCLSIALNHRPPIDCDYYFFANQKRYDEFIDVLEAHKVVITNNLQSQLEVFAILEYADLVSIDGDFFTNTTIIFLNYLVKQGVREVEIAGLDGYKSGVNNYSYDECDIQIREDSLVFQNEMVKKGLKKLSGVINVAFLTPSIFEEIEYGS